MYDEKLREQTFRKLQSVLKNYEELIFEKVGEIEEPQYLITKEHFRSLPSSGLSPLDKGMRWGKYDENLWVIGKVTITEATAGKKLYAVSHAGSGEEMFWLNGTPHGIFSWKYRYCTGGEHSAQRITFGDPVGTVHQIAFECCAGYFSVGENRFSSAPFNEQPAQEQMETLHDQYQGIDICVMSEKVKDFVIDLHEMLSLNDHLEDNIMTKYQIRRALLKIDGIIKQCPQHFLKEEYIAGVEAALEITRPFFTAKNSAILGCVGLTGHSHMDTAWLWPVKETIRKCARTFSNALNMMDEYPEYRFLQSSALHGEWMKKYYPDLFLRIKQRVFEGRYEPNGGVYVECDCNIPSGEFMIRQFLYGQRFTRENFDYTSDCFWLPDTFGYNGNIPQIMKGCGIRYFLTQKIYGNEVNTVPYDSFKWKGIDGSEVVCHYSCSGVAGDCEKVHAVVDTIKHKDSCDMHLLAYGFGDGGGGPSYGIVEAAHRASHCAALPEAAYVSVSQFMKRLVETYADDLPVFDGELYYEYHRGTLTQMHDVKKKNRQAEFAVRNMEYFLVQRGETYSEEAVEHIKNVLLNQFHDILPGTSVKSVYDVANLEMDENIRYFTDRTRNLIDAYTDGDPQRISVFNTLSFARNDVLVLDEETGIKGYATQVYTDILGFPKTAVAQVQMPALGCIVLEKDAPEDKSPCFFYDGKIVETPFAKVKFDEDGYISSFTDKASGRELKKADGSPLGAFFTAEDCPEKWDNWNVEYDTYCNLRQVHGFISREVVSNGRVEIRLRSQFRIDAVSTVIQDMVLYHDTPRVDFHTVIDWHSKHLLLKAGFDLDVRTDFARNEIQYGHVKRSTHQNTSIDLAKFEVCNHKWTDVSENRFGVAILNDCKYGISQCGCNLMLSLHRGGTDPACGGDCGKHEMTYSLLPHNTGFSTDSVISQAYCLNVPPIYCVGAAELEPLLSIDSDHIICECIKPAEAQENAYVLRLYECEGTAGRCNLVLNQAFEGAFLANMLEECAEEADRAGNVIPLCFKPFEIKTLVVKK